MTKTSTPKAVNDNFDTPQINEAMIAAFGQDWTQNETAETETDNKIRSVSECVCVCGVDTYVPELLTRPQSGRHRTTTLVLARAFHRRLYI